MSCAVRVHRETAHGQSSAGGKDHDIRIAGSQTYVQQLGPSRRFIGPAPSARWDFDGWLRASPPPLSVVYLKSVYRKIWQPVPAEQQSWWPYGFQILWFKLTSTSHYSWEKIHLFFSIISYAGNSKISWGITPKWEAPPRGERSASHASQATTFNCKKGEEEEEEVVRRRPLWPSLSVQHKVYVNELNKVLRVFCCK